jgi:hypothetical protein
VKRPNCVLCNKPATHVALFDEKNDNFRGSAVCKEHRENPTNATNRETLITRIEGFSVPDNAVCDLHADGILAGGSK